MSRLIPACERTSAKPSGTESNSGAEGAQHLPLGSMVVRFWDYLVLIGS